MLVIKNGESEITAESKQKFASDLQKAMAKYKGDAKSISIAAASIIAKVTRDRILDELDKKYPEYGYKNHKGYPTKAHLEAIEKYGINEEYRKSYKPVQKIIEKQGNFSK